MVSTRPMNERAARGAAAPCRPPRFTSALSASAARDAVRARWVAEQHFAYETTNDVDVILLSMKSTNPLLTAVLMPDEAGHRLVLARTTEEQHAFYAAGRKISIMLEAHVFNAVGAEWYGLVSGVLTHQFVASGEIAHADFVGLLPVSENEDTIAGEIGLGRLSSSAKAPDDAFHARATALHLQEERLSALQSRDMARLAAIYTRDAQIVARGYPEATQITRFGGSQIANFHEQILMSMRDTQIDVMAQEIEDWYSFVELLWEFRASDGAIYQFRTADISVIGADNLVSFQLGYGTDITRMSG